MRLLLTTDTVGGVWTFTRELTGQLLDRGHAVALVSLGRLPSPEQTAWCRGMRAVHPGRFRYEPSSVPLEWMETNEAAYAAAEPLLMSVAQEFSPDLLHSSQFCFGSLPLPIPRIITAHSDVLSWGEACRPEGLAASPWLTQYRRLVQQGLDAADAVAAPTRWMLRALERHFALPPSRHVILNGRTLPTVEPVPCPRLQAVSVGRFWDEAKNLSVLAHLDSLLPVLIAGEHELPGAEPTGPAGEQRTNPDSPNGIQALGFLDEGGLLEVFRSSSIYIAPSLYEPFGLAPLEAALCGCAVVANDIPSLREVWGDAALYFHDGPSLRALLERLISSPDILKAAQARSLGRARELTAARMADSYMALYAGLMGCSQDTRLAHRTHEELAAHGW